MHRLIVHEDPQGASLRLVGEPRIRASRPAGTQHAEAGRMHPMFFSVKQVHIASIRMLTPIAREAELTPARFDMLRTIALYDEWGMPQWKLVRLLGVSEAVVSRMLKELTVLGLVRRERYERDRRVKIIHLTEEGERRVHAILEENQWDGHLDNIATDVFRAWGTLVADDLYTRLVRARIFLKARAPFLHPWRRASTLDENLDDVELKRDDLDSSIPDEYPTYLRAIERRNPGMPRHERADWDSSVSVASSSGEPSSASE